MCADGRISGAQKCGKNWLIPINTDRPKDRREITGKYKNWRKKKNNTD